VQMQEVGVAPTSAKASSMPFACTGFAPVQRYHICHQHGREATILGLEVGDGIIPLKLWEPADRFPTTETKQLRWSTRAIAALPSFNSARPGHSEHARGNAEARISLEACE